VTDGTAEYNRDTYRVSFFYDLAKSSVLRMAFALGHELGPRGATAVALTPGWLRSEIMLDQFGVREENWRDALERVPHFAISETPRYVGRAVTALATDPEVARWNGSPSPAAGSPRCTASRTSTAAARTRGGTWWRCRTWGNRRTRPGTGEVPQTGRTGQRPRGRVAWRQGQSSRTAA
jgi:NAD(P)-dependent dehydrogenase (short-subunit alcohol dehydrogenase family)